MTVLFSSLWRYANQTVMADPGVGKYRLDAALLPTAVALSYTDDDGIVRPNSLRTGDYVTIRSTATSGDWQTVILISDPVDHGTWMQLAVDQTEPGANLAVPANNALMMFDFIRTAGTLGGWATPADVAGFLGIPTAAGYDDDWLIQATAAANDVAFRRRQAAGYVDDPTDVPDQAVKSGCILYGAALYRERGAVDGYASFSELGAFIPAGGSWGQIQRLWGVMRMQVG